MREQSRRRLGQTGGFLAGIFQGQTVCESRGGEAGPPPPRVQRKYFGGVPCTGLAALLLLVAIADSPAAAAPRARSKGTAVAQTLECAVCHMMAVEVQHALAATANSTEVIELSRRPSSDLGREQYQKKGRAIKYVDSEMRITDALQEACQVLKRSYRPQTIRGRRRLAQVRTIGDRPPSEDLEGVDWSAGGDKVHSVCEELAEERERDIIEAVRNGTDLSRAACFSRAGKTKGSSKAPCGNVRLDECPPGEFSLAADGSGGEPCWACERGKFQSESGATGCVSCPGDSSTRDRGSTSNTDCAAKCSKGSHGTGGVEPCEPCPLHTYQMFEGASECVQCPLGNGTTSLGTSSRDACVAICGDGRVAIGEGCDDGNVAGGDGCSAACEVEQGWKCEDLNGGGGANSRGFQTCQRLPASTPDTQNASSPHDHAQARAAGRSDELPASRTGRARGRSKGVSSELPVADARQPIGHKTRLGRHSRRAPRPPPLEDAEHASGASPAPRVGSAIGTLGVGTYVRVPQVEEILSAEYRIAHHQQAAPRGLVEVSAPGSWHGAGSGRSWLHGREAFAVRRAVGLAPLKPADKTVYELAVEEDLLALHDASPDRTPDQLVTMLLERYGMPADQRTTQAQLLKLGCRSSKECIGSILEQVYLRRAMGDVCRYTLGDAAEPILHHISRHTAHTRGTNAGAASARGLPSSPSSPGQSVSLSSPVGGEEACRCRQGWMVGPSGWCEWAGQRGVGVGGVGAWGGMSREALQRMEEAMALMHAQCEAAMGEGGFWRQSDGRSAGLEGECACKEGWVRAGMDCNRAATTHANAASGGTGGGRAGAAKEAPQTMEGEGVNKAEGASGQGNGAGVEAWKEADSACRQEFGGKTESDGRGGCKCVAGYVQEVDPTGSEQGLRCHKGSNKACQKQFGKGAVFDGANDCRCARGFFDTQQPEGRCLEGSDHLCQVLLGMGSHARFDGVHECVCKHGFLSDVNDNYKCVRGSSELCSAWHGLAEFDGNNNCVCRKGTVAVDPSPPDPAAALEEHQGLPPQPLAQCVVPHSGLCHERLGQHAEYRSALLACGCKQGFVQGAEGCVRGSNEVCEYLHGELARFNGASDCVCQSGTALNAAGKCARGSASMCEAVLGNHSVFNARAAGGARCMCQQGFIEVAGGCVPASDKQCRDNYGESTLFDGGNQCTCGLGRMYLKGKCVPLSDSVCATKLEPGVGASGRGQVSEFDGKDNCRCKTGYVQEESAATGHAVCVVGAHDVCVRQMGAHAEFDGTRTCQCRAGYVLVDGQCSKGSAELCKGLLGLNGRFDGLRSCVCEPGYLDLVSGSCAPGSDAACRKVHGQHAVFDGVRNCTCAEGYALSPSAFCIPRALAALVAHDDEADAHPAARSRRRVSGIAALQALRNLFDRLDANKDAVLSAHELKAATPAGLVLGPLQDLVTQDQRARWLSVADVDGDGYLDFHELSGLLTAAGVGKQPPASRAKDGVGGEAARAERTRDGDGGTTALSEAAADMDAQCKEQYGEGSLYVAELESCDCKDGFEATETGCEPTLDTQCQTHFGEGAFYDGEMCACKEGFGINKAGNKCEPKPDKAKNKAKNKAKKGKRSDKDAGGGSKAAEVPITPEEREESRQKTAGDVEAARMEAQRIREKEARSAQNVAAHLAEQTAGAAREGEGGGEGEGRADGGDGNKDGAEVAGATATDAQGGAGDGAAAGKAGPGDGGRGGSGQKEDGGGGAKSEKRALTEEEKEARMQRRKKREAERRWKEYFKSDAMAALNVLNKAKEAEQMVDKVKDKMKRPLAESSAGAGEPLIAKVALADAEAAAGDGSSVDTIHTAAHDPVPPVSTTGGGAGSASVSAHDAAAAGEGDAVGDAVKPPPLSDEEFMARLQKLKGGGGAADAGAPQGGGADGTGLLASAEARPAAAAAAPPPPPPPGGTPEARVAGDASQEMDGASRFCLEMYGVNSEYDAVEGQCRCKSGYVEDAQGTCVAAVEAKGQAGKDAQKKAGGEAYTAQDEAATIEAQAREQRAMEQEAAQAIAKKSAEDEARQKEEQRVKEEDEEKRLSEKAAAVKLAEERKALEEAAAVRAADAERRREEEEKAAAEAKRRAEADAAAAAAAAAEKAKAGAEQEAKAAEEKRRDEERAAAEAKARAEQEAEAEAARHAEEQRGAAEAEAVRVADEERKEKEAEEQAAAEAKAKAEAEAKAAQEKRMEKERAAAVAEAARLAEEAEKARVTEEAERARIVEEQRVAAEAEAARAAEAEAKEEEERERMEEAQRRNAEAAARSKAEEEDGQSSTDKLAEWRKKAAAAASMDGQGPDEVS